MDTSFGCEKHIPVCNLSRSSSLRNSCPSRTSLIRRNQSMNAKQIRFYRNGDRYFAGLKLAVSPERYKEFDSLLVELSEKLDLSSGAVRFIFNAEDGSLITDISQLQYGISYVCSSSNVLRQMNDGYGKHLHSNWAASQRTRSNSSKNMTSLSGGLLSVDISFNAGRSECSKDYIKPKLVTVIRNGKPPQTKVTLLLNSKTALSYEKVLDQLSARGSLGKVDKLYSVDGRQIKELRDLFDDDTVFIALSAIERFPDEGIELDPNSYRITPYRDLKRPVSNTVKRSNSLRNSIRPKLREENENLLANKSSNGQRPKSVGANTKVGGNLKVARPKNVNAKKQISDQNKDELYPTQVFEASSDSDEEKASVTVTPT